MSALAKLSTVADPSNMAAARARLSGARRKKLARQTPSAPRLLTAADEHVQPGTAWLPNPLQVGGETPRLVETTINRRVDILQTEFSAGRLTKGAFAVGRNLQAVFEASHMGGGSSWSDGDRVDVTQAKEAMILRKVSQAQDVRAEMDRLRGQIGDIPSRFLREILTGTSFAAYAARVGRSGDRASAAVGDRFRWLLEEVATDRLKRGVVR